MLKIINKYIGWRSWAVFKYNAVFENFFVLLFIAFFKNAGNSLFVKDSLLFILFSIFATTYGYLINDYSDIELDRQHGKSNTFADDSKSRARLVVMLSLLLFVLTSLPFWNRPFFIEWTVLWFLTTTFYSLPPIRLKERGMLNIIFVVAAQRLLPVLILFSVFDFWNLNYVLIILFYVFLRGLTSDINHQLEDYANDLKTGTQTFVVKIGFNKVRRIFSYTMQLEKIVLAILLIQFTMQVRFKEEILTWLWVGTLLLYFVSLGWFFLDKRQWPKNPFDAQKNLAQFLHHAYPSVALPLVLNLILLFNSLTFVFLLLFQILIRRLYSVNILTKNFLVDLLSQKLKG